MYDKTIIRDAGDKWVIERNFNCKPFVDKNGNIIEQPLKVDPTVKVTPGLCFRNNGQPFTTKEGLPVLMPRMVKYPREIPFDEMLKRVDVLKEKEKNCPACKRFYEEMKGRNAGEFPIQNGAPVPPEPVERGMLPEEPLLPEMLPREQLPEETFLEEPLPPKKKRGRAKKKKKEAAPLPLPPIVEEHKPPFPYVYRLRPGWVFRK